MEQYIFNEKEDFTFLIIKGNNFPMVHLKGDQYSFPLHNDLTISDRDSNLFFNKMNQSEQMVNVFIVSRRDARPLRFCWIYFICFWVG